MAGGRCGGWVGVASMGRQLWGFGRCSGRNNLSRTRRLIHFCNNMLQSRKNYKRTAGPVTGAVGKRMASPLATPS